MAIWGAESSPVVQQIKVNVPNAVSVAGNTGGNGNVQAPLPNIFLKPVQAPNVTPIRPAVQQPMPAGVVSGDNPPEITM
ncbi:MAG: hypothetical protein ACRERV_18340 [Methylococcales bacterium]